MSSVAVHGSEHPLALSLMVRSFVKLPLAKLCLVKFHDQSGGIPPVKVYGVIPPVEIYGGIPPVEIYGGIPPVEIYVGIPPVEVSGFLDTAGF